jgi:hypothetical protein
MLNSEAQGSTVLNLLVPADHADTAAATGTAVDITDYEGNLVIVQTVGVVTDGTIVGKLQHGANANGDDAADITGATFTSVGTSTDNSVQKISIPINGLNKYLRYVGTIATGPAVVGVVAIGKKKYST